MQDLATLLTIKRKTAEKLEASLAEMQRDIEALIRVQSMSCNGIGPTPTLVTSALSTMPNQKEALHFIATQNGGKVNIAEARDLPIEAGEITGLKKYAYGHLYSILEADDRFEQVGKGQFRLVEQIDTPTLLLPQRP